MGKGGYLGGSTNVGPGSGWFSEADPKTERIHAVGKLEGEAAQLRVERITAEKSAKIAHENAKIAKAARRQRSKAAAMKEKTLLRKASETPQETTTKSELQQQQRMERVHVETKVKKVVKSVTIPK